MFIYNMEVTYLSSATFASSRGLWDCQCDKEHTRRAGKLVAYSFSRPSTDVRITGKVVAKCFREEQKARTVFKAYKVLI